MNYLSIEFFAFAIIICFLYYLSGHLFHGRCQWCVLLLGSVLFYAMSIRDFHSLLWLAVPVIVSYLGGRLIQNEWKKVYISRILLVLAILLIVFPLCLVRFTERIPCIQTGIVAPVGISFYTLQLIAYVCDCYNRKIVAQTNPLKHILFSVFFPSVIQGPIPRYNELGKQLFCSHQYNSELFMHGLQKILFGVFLKLMIADKAALFVNTVYSRTDEYLGLYIVVAALLYSVQLYTDFYSCTLLCQGVALTLGIRLTENFNHPYFATSTKDFWRRWHISFSTWLRDYVYIPLGGNRKGKARRIINISMVFLVSGLWHGTRIQFLIWGGMHALYQIVGEATYNAREKLYSYAGIIHNSITYTAMKRCGTFILVSFAWVFFRADDMKTGILLIRNMWFYNPWKVFSTQLFDAGLEAPEFIILMFCIVVFSSISYLQEKGASLHKWIQMQHLVMRWIIYISVIVMVWIFGTYGFGYNAQDFIYGGF